MKKILILLVLSTSLIAQNAGDSGLAFLKFGFGARNIAMSDIGVVGVSDLSALNYNPSLLAVFNKTQLSFTHNALFLDMNSEMFSGSFSAFGLPVAIGVNTTNIGNIEIRSKPGDAESVFTAHYFAGSISTGYRIFPGIYLGVTYKYIYENIFSDDASGYGIDLGATYQSAVQGLTFGAAIRNMGTMKELHSEPTKLPTDIRFGAAYNFPLLNSKLDFTAVSGFQKYTIEDYSHFHAGLEAVYNKMFSLRLGFASGYDSKNISTGFGVIWQGLNLDYAYVPVKYGLGDSHILSVTYTFN